MRVFVTIFIALTWISSPVFADEVPPLIRELAGKSYVDNSLVQKVNKVNDESIAGIKTFDDIPLTATANVPAVGSSGAPRFVTELAMVSAITSAISSTVKTSGPQTVGGIKTFTDIPLAPTPALPGL